MKKIVIAATTAVLLSVSLTACGGNKSEDCPSPKSMAETAGFTAPRPAPAPVRPAPAPVRPAPAPKPYTPPKPAPKPAPNQTVPKPAPKPYTPSKPNQQQQNQQNYNNGSSWWPWFWFSQQNHGGDSCR